MLGRRPVLHLGNPRSSGPELQVVLLHEPDAAVDLLGRQRGPFVRAVCKYLGQGDLAGRTRFGRLISQGGIATGLLHALVAMDMPGPGTVFMQQEWHFPAPVYVGDTITAEATVKSINPRHPVATIDFRITNQDAIEVLTGEAVVMQLPLDPPEPPESS